MSEPVFTAMGVVTVDGERFTGRPFTFGPSGIHLVAQRGPDGGFEIIRGTNHPPDQGRFEKTCMEPVHFLVTRNGEPYWKVEVKAMFDSMLLDLITD